MQKFTVKLSSLLLFGWVLLSFMASSGDSDAPQDDSLLAYNLATECVKQQLKSPSTAEFAGLFEKKNHVTSLGGDVYKIRSYVDAQNSFGAVIRSQWSCTITLRNGGRSYTCADVVIN